MRFRLSPATVIALIALFVALGGPAWAKKKLISGSTIKKDTITSRQIRPGSLSRTDLSAGTIRFLQQTPDRDITTNQIATGAITGDKLALASVGSPQVADSTLTSQDLAPNSISAANLAADSVGFDEIAEAAVGKQAMRPASVGRSELQEGAVATEELGAQVAGITFTEIAAGKCQSVDAALTLPVNTDLTKTVILFGTPSTWPGDTVTLNVRAADDGDATTPSTTLRFSACNLGEDPVEPGAQVVPYAALPPRNSG